MSRNKVFAYVLSIIAAMLLLAIGTGLVANGTEVQPTEQPTPSTIVCPEEDSCHLDFHDGQWWGRECVEDTGPCDRPWTPLTKR